MCGITGLISATPIDPATIGAMNRAIAHRGPDDDGVWLSEDCRVGLGQRRLAIVDLSAAGHQPMTAPDGRLTLNFNGEIYNHAELRRELESAGHAPAAWRGHSDTETLLAAIGAWGFEETLRRARGMFAISLWDAAERRMTLARDRFGEKPLYYGWCRAGFAFASELKAMRTLPGFDNPVDEDAVRLLLGYNAIPAPHSIYRRIFKLEPGTTLSIPLEIVDHADDRPLSRHSPPGVRFSRYYNYIDVVRAGAANPYSDPEEARRGVREALTGAVAQQLIADVPVGTFLSGGVDSSLITALAATASSTPVKTFSIGFEDPRYDEAPYARAIAKHLGTDHHELYVSAEEARSVIPLLPTMYDEPFADSSQIPTYLVSRFARRTVTVALSGDAGDELFGGYNRHIEFPRLWRGIGRVPGVLRRPMMTLGAHVPTGLWNAAARLRSGRDLPKFFGDKVARAMAAGSAAKDFPDFVGRFLDQGGGRSAEHMAERAHMFAQLAGLPLETQIMAIDALSYLPDTILTKVDRASMAVSLEGRIAFLDRDVAAAAARVRPEWNIAGGKGKRILRDLLAQLVPQELIERPKAGFAAPIGPWLRAELRDWAEDLLAPRALEDAGLDAVPIRARWQEHLTERRDHAESLWSVLMLQAWRREQASG